MKQYSTFLFDFDGTLLDSNEHVISCFQKAFQHVLGKDLPRETITATFGIPLAQALQDLAPEHADELLRVYRQYSDEAGFSMLYEIDGAHDTIRALHDMGCTIAIVTSKKEVNATAQMDYIGISDYVDFLVGPEKSTARASSALGCLRPSPAGGLSIWASTPKMRSWLATARTIFCAGKTPTWIPRAFDSQQWT